MRALGSRTALQHTVVGIVLVAIVTLITILFNVLGAITCAILAGMMLGASSQWKWHIILVSLVFPVVTMAIVEFSKADIPWPKNVLLAVLCWTAFWVTYLLTYLLIYFERKSPSASEAIASGPTDPAHPTPSANFRSEPPPSLAPRQLSLEALQGQWSCETAPLNGQTQKRVLQVVGDEVVLCVTDANGQFSCQAKGRLKLE